MAVVTEELKGSKSPADDLQPGEEVKEELDCVKSIRFTASEIVAIGRVMHGNGSFSDWIRAAAAEKVERSKESPDLIRKSPPSDSETAELERKVVEAAISYHEGRSSDDLDDAVEALLASRNPRSLEDQIRAIWRDWAASGYCVSDRPKVEVDILALVKAHES